MERNIDKIKRLTDEKDKAVYEMRRWQSLAEAKNKECRDQAAQNDKLRKGIDALKESVDITLLEVTVMYGEELEDGSYILPIPRTSGKQTLEAFECELVKKSDTEAVMIAKPRKEIKK